MDGCLKLFIVIVAFCPSRAFIVIWNVPTEGCEIKYRIQLPLGKYNIQFNKNQTFRGDVVTIFYEPTPGLYPRFLPNGKAQNGGLPQLVDNRRHEMEAEVDILKTIPDHEFPGVAVIDWESWVPIFDRNYYNIGQKVYIKASESLVSKEHPEWNKTKVTKEARKQFQSSSRKLMEETLRLAKLLRPNGYWGYYGFPKCYNHRIGQKDCTADTMEYNNELCWMFNASSALFPSIYLKESFGSADEKRIKVEGIIKEAKRMKTKCADLSTPILAYSRFRYSDTERFYMKEDLFNTIEQSYNAGLEGVVLWDSYENFINKTDCINIGKYISAILGPVVKNVTRK